MHVLKISVSFFGNHALQGKLLNLTLCRVSLSQDIVLGGTQSTADV